MIKQCDGYLRQTFNKALCLLVCLLLIQSITGETQDLEDDSDVILDMAVKLKNDYADDVVSDLFATSHGLIKLSRAIEVDKDGLFHFRMKNPTLDEEDMRMSQTASEASHRKKRHVENTFDRLRNDERVEYVIPQKYLRRAKRSLSDITDEQLDYLLNKLAANYDQKIKEDDDDYVNERDLEALFEDYLRNEKAKEIDRNKQMLSHFNDEDNVPYETVEDDDRVHLDDLPKLINFNDKYYGLQWYLINEGQMKIPPNFDLNVKDAWLNGYTGKNISIVVIDDGLDHEHPDFVGKYEPSLSYDLNDEDHDPMPRTFDNNNNHGTKCAGAAAAAANNEVCGVGVAYNANIGGIRLLDGQITDLLEARSLLYKMNDTDIKTLSWGPMDDGTRMEHPHKFVNQALEDGVKYGRNGKGILYVWASGNGGARGDDCTCDGYVSNWNVISIGSINHHGLSTFYSEVCPSTFAVVYSGGKTKDGVDEDDPGVRVTTSDVRGKCSQNFQGTSAAAPVAAGVFALVLEANPDLTYRDVMHLVARTSKIPNKEDMKGWIINGGGYHVNEKYGFGVLDASQLIQEAQSWTNVPARKKCTINSNKQLEFDNQGKYEIDLIVTNECPEIDFLEHTVANISFSYPIRGEMQLTLISPSGTPSEILSYRPHDEATTGIKFFPFMTTHNWGESPVGKWRLIIEPKENDIELKGSIDYFSINFYGFKLTKSKISSKRSHGLSKSYKPSSTHIKNIYDFEFEQSRRSKIVHKRVLESDPGLRAALKRENN